MDLTTNASDLTVNVTGKDANGFAPNGGHSLELFGTFSGDITLTGGGVEPDGDPDEFELDDGGDLSISSITSRFDGELELEAVTAPADVSDDGLVVTTGDNSVYAGIDVDEGGLANGLVKYVDTGGEDYLFAVGVTGDYGFIDVTGFEVLSFAAAQNLNSNNEYLETSINLRDVVGYDVIRFDALPDGTHFNDNTKGAVEDTTFLNVASGTTFELSRHFGDDTGSDVLKLVADAGDADTLAFQSNEANSVTVADMDSSAVVDIEGFETLTLGTNEDGAALDLAGTLRTDATTLNVGSDNAGDITVSTLDTNVTITSLNVDSAMGAVALEDLGTASALEAITVDTGDATNADATTIGAGTTAALTSVTASGAGDFEITDLAASTLGSIDAAAVGGDVTIGDAAGGLTLASGAAIVTGEGDDTITMEDGNILTLDAGEASGDADTLIVIGSQDSGPGAVDLSSAGDQLTDFNGGQENVVQQGFENVDLSGVSTTGTNGLVITADAAGSDIVGSQGNDDIIGGAGDDTIDVGAGFDTVRVAFGGEGQDTIQNFTAGSGGDVFDFTGTIDTTDDVMVIQTVAGNNTINPDVGLVISDGYDAADVAGVEDLFDGTNGNIDLQDNGDELYLLSDDGTNSYLFKLADTGNGSGGAADGEITDDEVALVATFEGVNDATTLTAANFADFA